MISGFSTAGSGFNKVDSSSYSHRSRLSRRAALPFFSIFPECSVLAWNIYVEGKWVDGFALHGCRERRNKCRLMASLADVLIVPGSIMSFHTGIAVGILNVRDGGIQYVPFPVND